VHARADLFAGDRVAAAPDLFPTMVDEAVQLHDGLHAAGTWVDRRDLAWGTHAREGIVALHGAEPPGDLAGNAVDVTPTLLALMGLRAEGLDGRSLVPDEGAELVRAPKRTLPAGAYDADEEAAVMEHLRGLGYVE
jgi:predicted AlkP superfamily phosphohydrolase/phosphomutase